MKHQLTRKRIVSILLAVCMLVSMLSVGMAGALDVSEGSAYAEVNGGNAYYRYFIPALYQSQWYSNGADNTAIDAKTYNWTVFKNLWNATIGHSTNQASKLNGIASGGTSTHYGTDQMTDAFYLHQYDSNGTVIGFGKYYGVAGNSSVRMTIRVPSSDTYTLKANMYYGLGAQADVVDYWVAPDDAEDPMADDYYVGQLTGIKNGGTLDLTKFGEVGSVDLEAGEYIVTQQVNGSGAIYGGNLELWGSMAPTIVDLTADATAMNEDGYLEVPAGDEEGCWISITAEDRDFGELDLIEMDAPTYARVDEYSDMITAFYEDGMVNIKASYVGENPETSATLYLEVGGAATWVEIPVKVVQGAESIISLSHTGATDKIMANVGTYPITLKANIDGVDTAIGEEDEVSVEIVDADGNATDAVTATVNGANVSFKATEAGSYTALVSATVAGVSTKAAYEIPLTVTGFGLSYNFMKIGAKVTTNSAGWVMKEFIDSYADTWTGGSTDINTDVKSDGWKIGAKGGSGEWLWTTSAQAYGAYFAFAEAGSWNSVDIYVPVSGNYTITSNHTAWAAGDLVDYYLAPVGTADPIKDEYKLNAEPINHNSSSIGDAPTTVGTTDIEAGEYMLVIKSLDTAAGGGVFIKGVDLALNGEATGSKVWIDEANKFVQYSLSYPTNWTWVIKALPTFLAENVKFTWSSSNNNISQVNPNTSISHKHDGAAVMTITGSDGSTYSFPFVVGAADIEYKFLDAAVAAYKAAAGNTYLDQHGYADGTYETAEGAGFGAWFIKGGNSDYANANTGDNGYYGCFWATSVKDNGVTTGFGKTEDAYTQFQIRVDEAGKYQVVSEIDCNSVGWAPHSIYIAPVDAENAMADEYKLIDIYGTRMSGKKQTTTPLGEVELDAGEYLLTYKKLPSVNRSTAPTVAPNGLDYLNVSNVRFYKTDKLPAVALDTVDGAQIRTTGKQGLRFISSIAKSGDWAYVKEVGTVLIPTADLEVASDLTIGYSANGHDALKVPAAKYYSEDDNKIEFTAVITDIAAANYGRAISARAYAIVTDVYGTDHIIYGEAVTSRSVLQVAQNGLLDPNATDEEKVIFQQIVDAANA